MINTLIFTTCYDKSVVFFPPAQIYNYERLYIKNGKLFFNKKPLLILSNQKIILRDPYNTGVDYSFFLRLILHHYFDQVCLDRQFLKNNPYYEDKLQQNVIFHHLQLPTPQTFWTPHLKDNLSPFHFPCLLKRRYSSRCRFLQKINSWQDYEDYFLKKLKAKRSDYLIQELIKVVEDWRILVFKGKILGVIKRQTGWKSNGKISLLVKEAIAKEQVSNNITQQVKKLVSFLKIDFAGIDIVFDKSGQHYFLECNFSPQFKSFLKYHTHEIESAFRLELIAQ